MDKKENYIPRNTALKKRTVFDMLGEAFHSNEAKKVKDYMVDTFFSNLKRMTADILSSGFNMVLYGDSRPRDRWDYRGSQYQERVSYRSRYDDTRRMSYGYGNSGSRYRFENNILYSVDNSKRDLDEALDKIMDNFYRYTNVRLSFIYDEILNKTGYPQDNNYGWTDLRGLYVENYRNEWVIRMPGSPIPIE